MTLQPIKIKHLSAREILDSRGIPTIEVELTTAKNTKAVASIPAGRSIGKHEALELRDGNKKRFRGLGVFKAVHNVDHTIQRTLQNKIVSTPQAIDKILLSLDASPQKRRLGAQALLGVSLAGARALAKENKLPFYLYLNKAYDLSPLQNMPMPMLNIFNGGKHADTNLDVQELMIVPKRKKLFSERLRVGVEIYYTLGDVLKKSGFDTDIGDEGGYAPDIHSTTEAIRMIMIAAKDAGYIPGREVFLAIDVGSSALYDHRLKHYRFKLDAAFYNTSQMITLYEIWLEQFPLLSIEDGLAEDDFHGWRLLQERLGKEVLIVGDDLFVTNSERLKKGIKEKAANAIIIKPNQVGTLTECMETVRLAKRHNMAVIVSHRSGETNDDAIADIAVAVQAEYVKFGAPARGERVSKYNRLLAIEDDMLAANISSV